MVDLNRLGKIERKGLAFGDLSILGMDSLSGEDFVEQDVSRATGKGMTNEFKNVENDAVRILREVTREVEGI